MDRNIEPERRRPPIIPNATTIAAMLADLNADDWTQKYGRDIVLGFAREAQSEFTALRPSGTGLGITAYASERNDLRALIVDSQPGLHLAPSRALARTRQASEPAIG